MRISNEAAATAYRVLDKCTEDLEAVGPWRWSCAVRNGARLPMDASLDEGFLQLACRPEGIRRSGAALERALMGNSALSGGVKLALNSSSSGLHLRAELAVLDERQLLDRMDWALKGFHDGVGLLRSLDCDSGGESNSAPRVADSAINLGELLRGSSWSCTERGPNDFSARLSAESAPPASIRMTENGLELSVELVRANAAAEMSRQALAVFLLTVSGALRMARGYAMAADGQESYGFQVCLPAAPAAEEIDHALAALSIAYRMCAREADVLLNDAAARCYLAARESSTNPHQHEEEN